MGRPRLLVLDEPTEGVQPSIVKAIEAAIMSLKGRIAILLVEQYYDFARTLADRYIVLERGAARWRPRATVPIWIATASADISLSDSRKPFMPKHHVIPPTPENMVLGYLDANTPPVLQVESGDSVTLTSFPAGGRESLPEASRVPADYMAALTALPPGPGPHFITGPIHVRGAQPGDTLQVDILDATPTMDWGFVAILPLLGTLPDEFTDYETIHPVIDRARGVCTLPWGTELPLDPFFGIIGVAPHWRPAGDPDRGRQQGRPYAAGQAFPAMTVGAARVGRPTSIGAPRACRWSRSSTHKDRCHCCPRGR